MSIIDEKIVSLKFDNKDFEKNAKESMGTLDDLKDKLDTTETAKALSGISGALKSIDLSGLSESVSTVHDRFSTLGIIGVTALANIANKAVEAGERIAKSLTIDQITAGFSEYELKMGSIQTIMASTGKDLGTVNNYLEELNKYADKTIYSFSDMTSNIGKFTNAGVELETAVKAIQGVSNVAAVSGANAQQASHAMYNFAQALSAGYVKLIDWKSIENANMATVEFKNQLLETAVAAGKLEKTADGMYKVLTTNMQGSTLEFPIDATHSFNESLNYQWMTTEVLTATLGKYADETTEIGKKAFAAAQDIKTFTQLIDTLKESSGSGWAQTFEYIIGDFDEAKVLFTNLNNVIGGFLEKTSEARNATLKEWHDLGGRDRLIASLGKSLKSLVLPLQVIKDGFKDLFPKSETNVLMKFTEGFEKLSDTFTNLVYRFNTGILKNLVRDIVTVLKYVKEGFAIITRPLGVIFDKVTSLINNTLYPGIKNLLSRFSMFVLKLDTVYNLSTKISMFADRTATRVTSFLTSVQRIFKVLKNASSVITIPLKTISGIIKEIAVNLLGNIDGGISNFLDKFRAFSKNLEKNYAKSEKFVEIGNKISDVIANIYNKAKDFTAKINLPSLSDILKKIWEVLKKIANAAINIVDSVKMVVVTVIPVLKKVWDYIVKVATGIRNEFLKIVTSDGFILFKRFFEEITNLVTGLFNFIGKVGSSLIKNISKVLGETDTRSIIDIFNVGMLATIVTKISNLLDPLGDFGDLIQNFREDLALVSGALKAFTANIQADTLLKIAGSVAILAVSLLLLASIDQDAMGVGIEGITLLLSEVMIVFSLLSNIEGSKGARDAQRLSKALLKITEGILVLSLAAKLLASIKPGDLARAISSIGVLLLMMSLFTIITDPKRLSNTGKGLVYVAASIVVLAVAAKLLATIKPGDLSRTVGAIGALLLAVSLFSVIVEPKAMLAAGAGMIGIAASLLIIAAVCKILASIKINDLTKAVVIISALLAVVGIFTQIVSNSSILASGVGLIGIATSLLILAGAAKIFATMSGEDLMKAGVAIGGFLMLVAAASLIISPIGVIALAGSMLIMAASLIVIAGAAATFAAIPWKALAKVGVVLLATFVALFAGAALVMALGPAMIAFVGIVAAFGAAVALLGAGIALIGVGFSILAVSAAAGSAALVAGLAVILEGVIGLIPLIVIAVAEGLNGIMLVLISLIPTIIELVTGLLVGLIDVVVAIIPPLVEAVITIIDSLLQSINEHLPSIITSIQGIITTILEALPETLTLGIIALLNGIADTLEKHTDDMVAAVHRVLVAVWNAMKKFFTQMITDVKELGSRIMKSGFIQAIKDKITAVKEAVSEFVQGMKDKFHEKIEDMKEAGKNLINGLIEGIKSIPVVGTIVEVGENVVKGIKGVFKEHSPSRVFREIGQFATEGLALGFLDYEKEAVQSAEGVGYSSVDALQDSLNGLSDIVDGNMQLNPVIRPILDLSAVTDGANSVGSLFNSTQMSLNANKLNQNGVLGATSAQDSKLAGIIDAVSGKYAGMLSDALANATFVANVGLEGDAAGLFKAVRTENSKFVRANGYNPLVP